MIKSADSKIPVYFLSFFLTHKRDEVNNHIPTLHALLYRSTGTEVTTNNKCM